MINLNEYEEEIFNRESLDLSKSSFSTCRNDILFDDAKRTVPLGVEILENKLNKTSIHLKYGKLTLLIFRMYVPIEKEESLKKWVEDYEHKFDVHVIIQREQGYSGIKSLFARYFKDKTLLTSEDIDDIRLIRDNFFGTPPKISSNFIQSREKLNEKLIKLPDIPFIAIDSEDTTDPEDAFVAEKVDNDIYHLTVAIADISWLILPRGKQKDYAINLGSTIYGTDTRISTLGNLANYEESHLSLSKLTPAWIFKFEIKKGKKTKLIQEPFLAKVRIHKKITPQEIDGMQTLPDEIVNLANIAQILQFQRLGISGIEHSLSETQSFNSNTMISEIIIKTKECFANFLNKHKAKKAIFKVQRTLSLNKQRDILRNLKKINVQATNDIFKYPECLIQILSQLQEMCFTSRIHSHHDLSGAQKILNDIINVFFKRSYYDNANRGHAFLHVTSYCDVKGRLAAGIINQIQARNIVQNFDKSYSTIEIQKIAKKLNRQIRTYGIKFYTLRFLEMLSSKLKLVNQEFTGNIVNIHDNKIFVEVDGFKKWGVIISNTNPLPTIGTSLKIKLKGYSLVEQRFLFDTI